MLRVFGFVGTVVTMAIGMYIYSLQVKTLSPGGGSGNPEDFATIAGVKNDLIGIANAERGYLASQGNYASLDELISGNYISVKERPPYIYDVKLVRQLSRDCDSHHERRPGAAGLPRPCRSRHRTESLAVRPLRRLIRNF